MSSSPLETRVEDNLVSSCLRQAVSTTVSYTGIYCAPLENRDGAAGVGLGLRSGLCTLLDADLGEAGAAVLNRGSSASRLLSVRARSRVFFSPLLILPIFWGGTRVSWPWWATTLVKKGAIRPGSLRPCLGECGEVVSENELIVDGDKEESAHTPCGPSQENQGPQRVVHEACGWPPVWQ